MEYFLFIVIYLSIIFDIMCVLLGCLAAVAGHASLMFCCWCFCLSLLLYIFYWLISEVAWLIITILCHMFDGDRDLCVHKVQHIFGQLHILIANISGMQPAVEDIW